MARTYARMLEVIPEVSGANRERICLARAGLTASPPTPQHR